MQALYHYAIAVRLEEQAGDESAAVAARYRRGTLARSLPPAIVADAWHRSLAFVPTAGVHP
jgi:hypothetical protein